ncbi:pimeloyl-ACP methyl ester carboxylesterase [Prauserella shujinwangii]|uniref:Pimeloyl-ACP methyl ester carboxylesterase n=1 Tax=Prauserella shujinwangii TaxID=1453103 RepID=A0A2T0M1E8_9PSEU|nr:alpha/beta hydrolase [Prauserella shujinwangii]PRX50380.1 pimeloyl-ACP methyl ester carboxylesterase [Prauserella shujinwangii]
MRSEYTWACGTRVHAEVAGPPDGPGVVCVHGLGCSHRYFRPLMRRLATTARVSAPDLPGFGGTPGPGSALDVRGMSLALAGWLRATGRGGSVLVGNSAGCQVIVDLAVHAPGLLGPVVLNGPTIDRCARTMPRQLGRLLADAPRERPTLWAVLAWDYLRGGPLRALATLRHLLADPVEDKLGQVRGPAVVVWGARDPIVPRRWAREVAEGLPHGALVEVPGAPHAVNFTDPDPLARVVRTLLPS